MASLLEGVELLKHCSWPTRPHRRLVWLDVSDPRSPSLMWGLPRRGRKPASARQVRLLRIESINKGMGSERLRRSGSAERQDCYFTVAGRDSTSLDVEFPSPAAREAFFDGFYAMLAAFGEAYSGDFADDAIVPHVIRKVDHAGRHRVHLE